MKTICIVIPVYKSHSFISRLFSSLNQASATNLFSWTIYFVDDSPEVDFNWDSFIAGLKIKNKVFKNIDWVRNKKIEELLFQGIELIYQQKLIFMFSLIQMMRLGQELLKA